MTDHDNNTTSPAPPPAPPPTGRRIGKGMFALALAALVVAAGVTGNFLTTAFGQGFGSGFGSGWRPGGFMGGPLTPAQIDERIDRMTKHMAIELDATPDQQMRIASIAKSAVADLRPLREKAEGARTKAIALLTAPTIDRAAVEQLRADEVQLADTASKRIAQALADASDVLTPDQRAKVANWAAFFQNGPWARWRRG